MIQNIQVRISNDVIMKGLINQGKRPLHHIRKIMAVFPETLRAGVTSTISSALWGGKGSQCWSPKILARGGKPESEAKKPPESSLGPRKTPIPCICPEMGRGAAPHA